MLKKGAVKKAFKWQVFNISLQAILQIAFIMISARLLPKEVHGAYAIINSFIFVLSLTSEGGMSLAIIQSKEVNEKHISISFYITLGMSLLMFLLMVIFSGSIAQFYNYKVTPDQLCFASLIFIFKALGAVSRASLVREFRFKEIFIAINLSFLIGNIGILCVMAYFDYGVYALIGAYTSMFFLQSLLMYVYARHSFKIVWGREEFKYLFHFGTGSILLQTANYLSSQVDKMLVGKYFSVTSLSLLEKGQFIAKMPPKYIGNTIDSIMFSAFAKISENHKKSNYYRIIMKLVMTSIFLFAVSFYFNAEIIVQLILGDNWTQVVPFLEIFSFMMPAIILARLGDVIVRAENKMFRSLYVKVGFLITLIITIVLLQSESLLYISGAILIVYWLHAFAMVYLSAGILKSPVTQYISAVLFSVMIAAALFVKYWIVETLETSGVTHLIINLITDLLLLAAVVYHYKDTSYITSLTTFIKNKINPSK